MALPRMVCPIPNIAVGFLIAILSTLVTKPTQMENEATEKIFKEIHKTEKIEMTRRDWIELLVPMLALLAVAAWLTCLMAFSIPPT